MKNVEHKDKNQPAFKPLAVSEPDAAQMLGVSPRTLWGEADAGRIKPVFIGSRKVYPMRELRRYLEVKMRESTGARKDFSCKVAAA